MNEELYVENISFGLLEIDTNKIFSRVGKAVSMRLVTDPHTGQQRWLAFVEMASKVNPGKALAAKNLKFQLMSILGFINRHSVLLRRMVMVAVPMMLIGGVFSKSPEKKGQREAKSMGSLVTGGTFSKAPGNVLQPVVPAAESDIDQEIRRVMEKGINLEERKRQIPAIVSVFSKRTDPQRARRLAALCYLKTLGTPFMPLDIAVIALAETGGFGLSGKAVSPKGALGVWQLMPQRAKSHGYTPGEMKNDEKCAEAAVRELSHKLKMAKGNLVMAKKLYCGAGPAADAYLVKIKHLKKEILAELFRLEQQRNVIKVSAADRFS